VTEGLDLPALMLSAFANEPLITIVIPGEPRSKARPRFSGKGHVYSDAKQVAHAKLLGWHFLKACPKPLIGGVAVTAVFYRSNSQRIDVDNMTKQILDAANGLLWRDDYQVIGLYCLVRIDPENPRTEIGLCELADVRGSSRVESSCANCGKAFERLVYPSTKKHVPTYCSRVCSRVHRKNPYKTSAKCSCGQTFMRKQAAQRYCSDTCRLTALHALPRRTGPRKPPPKCELCGVVVSRREYTRCRACWSADKTSVVSLEGVAYANDRQIDKGSHERITGRPRTEITLEVLP